MRNLKKIARLQNKLKVGNMGGSLLKNMKCLAGMTQFRHVEK
jgi:hypothetical protein